VTEEMVFLQS